MSDDYERVKTWCNDPRKMPCAPYNSICRVFEDYDRLRAELADVRRVIDEARKQEPVAMVVHHNPPFGAVYKVEWYTKYRDLPNGTKLYAAPVPAQPAVPDGYTPVRTDEVMWLLGENGEFECPQEQYFRGNPAPYFWRRRLRAAILSATEGRKDE